MPFKTGPWSRPDEWNKPVNNAQRRLDKLRDLGRFAGLTADWLTVRYTSNWAHRMTEGIARKRKACVQLLQKPRDNGAKTGPSESAQGHSRLVQ